MTKTPFITIDAARCIRCGNCATVCPNGVFRLDEQTIVLKYKGRCIRCGHCEAVCETGAFKHEEISRAYVPMDDGVEISPKDLQQVFNRRRSCRVFKSAPVGDSDFTELLRAAASAPTATNAQNVRFIRLDDTQNITRFALDTADYYLRLVRRLSNPFLRTVYRITVGRRIVDAYRYHLPAIQERFDAVKNNEMSLFYNAPMVLVGVASGLPHMAFANVNLAMMQIMLKAETLGLGTLYNGYALTALVRDKRLCRKMGIQPGYTPGAVLAVGYPSIRFHRSPQRRIPRVILMTDEGGTGQ